MQGDARIWSLISAQMALDGLAVPMFQISLLPWARGMPGIYP